MSQAFGLKTLAPTLKVTTEPALAAVRFRVNGFDYWTQRGHWTTEKRRLLSDFAFSQS